MKKLPEWVQKQIRGGYIYVLEKIRGEYILSTPQAHMKYALAALSRKKHKIRGAGDYVALINGTTLEVIQEYFWEPEPVGYQLDMWGNPHVVGQIGHKDENGVKHYV